MSSRFAPPALLLTAMGLCSGCGGPSQVNNDLRRQGQLDEQKIAGLQQQHLLDAQLIGKYQSQQRSLPTLGLDRLEKLYTARSLKFGRLTGGSDLDQGGPGDRGLLVAVVPVDQQGDAIKAAGRFRIEAFDLAQSDHTLLGQWNFDEQQSRQCWFSNLGFYTYMFKCPWETPPGHAQITLRVTFFDELTQSELPPAQTVVNVNVGSASATTMPSPQ